MNGVSNRQLLAQLESLAQEERKTTLSILLRLGEVERRRLHVSLGYASMYDFATRHLRYSASAANRRIRVARAIRQHPELLDPLRRAEINLSTIALISGVLDKQNLGELIDAISGKSQREVELIVAQYGPAVKIRDRVRPVLARGNGGIVARDPRERSLFESGGAERSRSGNGVSTKPVSGTSEDSGRPGGVAADGRSHSRGIAAPGGPSQGRGGVATGGPSQGRGGVAADRLDAHSRGGIVSGETRFRIQFAVRADFVRKLDEARSVLSQRYPRGVSLEELFEIAMDSFLDRHSPARRRERRAQKKRRKQEAGTGPERVGSERHAYGQPQARNQREAPSRQDRRQEKNGGRHRSGRASGLPPDTKETPRVRRESRTASAPGTHRARGKNPGTNRRPARAGTSDPASRTRAIPAAVRDEVFARDGGRCTFVSADGIRCGSRHNLQIDHIKPFARGGSGKFENLRLLCAQHNRLEAERVYGSDWMEQFRSAPRDQPVVLRDCTERKRRAVPRTS